MLPYCFNGRAYYSELDVKHISLFDQDEEPNGEFPPEFLHNAGERARRRRACTTQESVHSCFTAVLVIHDPSSDILSIYLFLIVFLRFH